VTRDYFESDAHSGEANDDSDRVRRSCSCVLLVLVTAPLSWPDDDRAIYQRTLSESRRSTRKAAPSAADVRRS